MPSLGLGRWNVTCLLLRESPRSCLLPNSSRAFPQKHACEISPPNFEQRRWQRLPAVFSRRLAHQRVWWWVTESRRKSSCSEPRSAEAVVIAVAVVICFRLLNSIYFVIFWGRAGLSNWTRQQSATLNFSLEVWELGSWIFEDRCKSTIFKVVIELK